MGNHVSLYYYRAAEELENQETHQKLKSIYRDLVPYNISGSYIVAILSFGFAGLYKIEMLYDLIKIIPALLIGSWIGIKIYALINEALFRQVILGLIFLAGLVLLF